MSRLDGKIVVITGVGSGIGLAATRLFCDRGATVFGIDINPRTGQSLSEELQAKGQSFQFYEADLSTEQACVEALAKCHQNYGRIDVLYNNAGISIISPFAETNSAIVEKTFAINFMSVFYLCQQVIPKMQAQGSGVIINTASELALVAQPLYSTYCASKGAVMSFTRALALEYAQSNIRINMLCPGPIETPMLEQEFQLEEDPAIARQQGLVTMPIGRYGYPEEVAKVALFLASDAPTLMHGSALVIDGAKTIV
jgi:NAD(P)-dependent dehydrogenase (short-subunit alcohol dehydrogenase family)